MRVSMTTHIRTHADRTAQTARRVARITLNCMIACVVQLCHADSTMVQTLLMYHVSALHPFSPCVVCMYILQTAPCMVPHSFPRSSHTTALCGPRTAVSSQRVGTGAYPLQSTGDSFLLRRERVSLSDSLAKHTYTI